MHLIKQLTVLIGLIVTLIAGTAPLASAGGYYDHVPTTGIAVCKDGGIEITATAENIYDWSIDLVIYVDGVNGSVMGIIPGTVGTATIFLPTTTTFNGEVNGQISQSDDPYAPFVMDVNIASTPLECATSPEPTVPDTTPATTTTTVQVPSTTVAPVTTTSTPVVVVPTTVTPSTTVPVEIGEATSVERPAPTAVTPVASVKELAQTGEDHRTLGYIGIGFITVGYLLWLWIFLRKTFKRS